LSADGTTLCRIDGKKIRAVLTSAVSSTATSTTAAITLLIIASTTATATNSDRCSVEKETRGSATPIAKVRTSGQTITASGIATKTTGAATSWCTRLQHD
jgi:hypothetical protein